MIKSLLQFNNSNDLTKDEIKGVPWKVVGTVASSQDGKFRNCLSMNGNGYLQNNTIDLSLDKEWTLDMWVYSDSYSSSSNQPFFSVASNASPKSGILSEVGELYIGLNSGTWWHTSLHMPINRWVHFALVNQLQTLYAFVNGVEQVKRTNQDIILNTTPEILLGSDRTIPTYFSGLVDEFRISDKALWTSDFTPPTHEASVSKYIFIDKNNTVMGMKE